MYYPKVTIVTVNYKQPTVTSQLLDSIAALSYPNIETIVVDNDQQYDDSMLYKIHLPSVKVINCKENLGFAGGNNVGIREAKGRYVLLLNNDTEIKDGLIEELLDVLDSDDSIGAVSPILKYYDSPEQIQYAGFTQVNPLTGRNELIRQKPKQTLVDTPYFHGAAVMMPMQVIEECGLMPEEYFLYYEELEWSRQFRQKGYSIKVATNVEVLHKESITTGKNSPLKVYYQNRNRVHFMKKSTRSSTPFLLFYLFLSVPKGIVLHVIRKEWRHLKALIKATKDALVVPKYGKQAIA